MVALSADISGPHLADFVFYFQGPFGPEVFPLHLARFPLFLGSGPASFSPEFLHPQTHIQFPLRSFLPKESHFFFAYFLFDILASSRCYVELVSKVIAGFLPPRLPGVRTPVAEIRGLSGFPQLFSFPKP